MAGTDENTIISVKKQRKTTDFWVTFSDGRYYGISKDLVMKYGLVKGLSLSPEELDNVLGEQRLYDVRQTAYAYVSYKPRTEKQVRDKMKEKGFTDAEASIAVNFLKEFNYLDDQRYARLFVSDYIKRKPSAEPKLMAELYKRGIDKNTAREVLIDIYPAEDKLDMALKAAEKKLRSVSHKPQEKQKELLAAYLQRQGFDWDIIRKVLGEALQ